MWWHTVTHGRGSEGETGELANGVGSQYSSHYLGTGVSSITTADAHTSAASSRLNWRQRRFKWTRPFRRKTKSVFCACAITFQTQSTLCAITNFYCSINNYQLPNHPYSSVVLTGISRVLWCQMATICKCVTTYLSWSLRFHCNCWSSNASCPPWPIPGIVVWNKDVYITH